MSLRRPDPFMVKIWIGGIIFFGLLIWGIIASGEKDQLCRDAGGIPMTSRSGFICLSKDAVLHPVYKGEPK
jgi:hypothetical protein